MAELTNYGKFVKNIFKATPGEIEALPERSRKWREAIERGEIPFEPVGLGVARRIGGKLLQKGLPKFQATEEAIEFGSRSIGRKEVIRALEQAWAGSRAKIARILRKPKSMEVSQEAMDEAIKGQFFREAWEVATERFPHKGGR